jgi:hypothetical protein
MLVQPIRDLRHLPLQLKTLRPPYDRFHELPVVQLSETRNVPGAITVVAVAQPKRVAESLREWIPKIRRASYWAPLVVRLDRAATNEQLYLNSLAARLRISGVLLDGEPPSETLRMLLSEPTGFPEAFVELISLARPDAGPRTRDLVAKLVHLGGGDHRTLPDVLKSAGTTDRTARRWLRAASLPGPRDFVRFGWLSPILLDLQRQPTRGIEPILRAYGPFEASSLAHLVERLIGVRPTEIRRTIGWEWWATRFLDRHRPRS